MAPIGANANKPLYRAWFEASHSIVVGWLEPSNSIKLFSHTDDVPESAQTGCLSSAVSGRGNDPIGNLAPATTSRSSMVALSNEPHLSRVQGTKATWCASGKQLVV